MKVGDLVKSIGPAGRYSKKPVLAIVVEILSPFRVRVLWCDNLEFDKGAKRLFEVINESR